jgi:16S rRNA (cytidine1402-2'-O)-methyltransferase
VDNDRQREAEGATARPGDAADSAEASPAGGGADGVAQAARAEVARLVAAPLAGGLYLVATPIGNLGDITLRALAVLARADVIYCEDTRHSRTLAAHFRLRAPLKPYHEHNGAVQRPRILAELEQGRCVALISDAGTPLVSDPGFKLVREAVEAGHRVESLPGPSAALAALTSSGLPTDTFFFAGFLPPRSAARRTRIEELARVPSTLVFYEAPQRLAESLADLAAVLGARDAAVARELTKLHEEVRRASLAELASHYAGNEARGEIAIVVGPPGEREVSDADIATALERALADMRLKDASKAVAEALGVARGRVYDIGLQMRSAADGAARTKPGDDE